MYSSWQMKLEYENINQSTPKLESTVCEASVRTRNWYISEATFPKNVTVIEPRVSLTYKERNRDIREL